MATTIENIPNIVITNQEKPNRLTKVRQFFGLDKLKCPYCSKVLNNSERCYDCSQQNPSNQHILISNVNDSTCTFHERYIMKKHLGAGSYSIVKHVIQRCSLEEMAVKIIDKNKLSRADRMALQQEITILAKLDHLNIMKLYEVIEDETTCYIIGEYMASGDLFDMIVSKKKLNENEAQRIMSALIEAVHYCHSKNIIHRDIKPENILLDGIHVKLCDFGFAKQLSHIGETLKETCGTPGYAAPELINGKPYGIEVDIFSMGIVTYILLCGYPPFPMKLSKIGKKLPELKFPSKDWNTISESIKELISKMLSENPKDRPSTTILIKHPWIKKGKENMKIAIENEKIQLKLQENKQKQIKIDLIMELLICKNTNDNKINHPEGLEVIKYGRNGSPHTTKIYIIRLNRKNINNINNIKPRYILTWDSKFAKRKFFKYDSFKALSILSPKSKLSSSFNNTGNTEENHNITSFIDPSSSSSFPTISPILDKTNNHITSSSERNMQMNSFITKIDITPTKKDIINKDINITCNNEDDLLKYYSFIELDDVIDIVSGCETSVFNRHKVDPSKCLSLITNHRTLDLEMTHSNSRDLMVYILRDLLKVEYASIG